jgi:hypothetical protein
MASQDAPRCASAGTPRANPRSALARAARGRGG